MYNKTQELEQLIIENKDRLNEYQWDFVTEMLWRCENHRPMTPRQFQYLETLVGKMRVWQRLQGKNLR